VRLKADASQLNPPHETENKNRKKLGGEIKNQNIYAESKLFGQESVESVLRKEKESTIGRICETRKF